MSDILGKWIMKPHPPGDDLFCGILRVAAPRAAEITAFPTRSLGPRAGRKFMPLRPQIQVIGG